VTWVKWNHVLVHLEIVLILVQDRCTVCAQCTTGMKMASGTPDGTPRYCMSSESLFRSVWIVLLSAQDRCTVCTKRTIGSKIILTQPMVLQGDVGRVEARFGLFRYSVNLGVR
jgi:hypothetical protein